LNAILRVIVGVLLGFLVLVICGAVASIIMLTGIVKSSPSLAAFTHTLMAILSLILIYLFSKGKMSTYGLKRVRLRALIRPSAISLVVGGVLIIVQILLRLDAKPEFLAEFSVLQIVVLICVYASIAEELLTRGFLQSILAPLTKKGLTIFRTYLSVPVLVSAVFFGLMHLVQMIEGVGSATVLYTIMSAVILGIIAGYYREKTGSIIPAIVVHMLFNVWGVVGMFLDGLGG